jgi:pyridoxal phosphate enzyme (YggS family)
MSTVKQKYLKVLEKIQQIDCKANLIAVSKTKPKEDILELIKLGHLHFGENKLQEAILKWTSIKKEYQQITLHFLGRLQNNKINDILEFFDYIHTIDSIKHADKIKSCLKKPDMRMFIEVNLKDEPQKGGVSLKDTENLVKYCKNELKLNIIGLMCIPPANEDASYYFKILKSKAYECGLKELSMGMSNDYEQAAKEGATFLRVGSAIFGNRGELQ